MGLGTPTTFPLPLTVNHNDTVLRAIMLAMIDSETGDQSIDTKPTIKDNTPLMKTLYTAIISAEVTGGVVRVDGTQMAGLILCLKHYRERLLAWIESHPESVLWLGARAEYADIIMTLLRRGGS